MLAIASARIHEAAESSPIRLAHLPGRSELATIGCIQVTGIVTQSAAANGEAAHDLNRFWPQC
jgi:hypothetical protein